MSFKYDWFTPIKATMEKWVPKETKKILEIGSFEGLSTCWFMDHCPDSTITCIDTFEGGEDQQTLDIANLLARFTENTAAYGPRICVRQGNSWEKLTGRPSNHYDVVFVDGSHVASDVLNDLTQSFRVCKPGGLIIADDYSWENQRTDCPKVAIDAFIRCFVGRVEVLEQNRLMVMRKIC